MLSIGNIERLATAIGASLVVVEDPYTDPPPGNPAHALVKEASALADEKFREVLVATVQPTDIEMY